MRRPLLFLTIAFTACLAWPAQGFAANGALMIQSAVVPVPGSQYELDFSVSRGRYMGDRSPELSIELGRLGAPNAAELHVAQFALPPWSLTTSAGTRTAQLHTETWLGSWGSIDMTFKASGSARSTTRAVGSCNAVPVHELQGTLSGRLALGLPGIGTVRLGSLKVQVFDYPSMPDGCLSQSLTPSCVSGNSRTSDGAQLLAELELDTFQAGPQPAAPLVSEFYVDATIERSSGSTSTLVLVGFLDSPQETRPALVIHYLLMAVPLNVDPIARTATLTVNSSFASGSLSFAPTPGVPPLSCGDLTLIEGSVSGNLTVNFGWGGARTYNGSTVAILTLAPATPSPAPSAGLRALRRS